MRPTSFIAYDAAGNIYTILCGPFTGAFGSALRDGLKTSDGQHVNRLEKGKYEILTRQSGLVKILFQQERIVVTADDPDAP